MTLDPEEKIELSNYRMEKSRSLLRDAELLITSGSYESSINRSFYALLSAAKSLLILRGIDPESHDGAKTMLSKEFIRTGMLEKESGEAFRSLQSRRLDSDYGDYMELGIEEAGDSLEKARKFVAAIEKLREKIITDG